MQESQFYEVAATAIPVVFLAVIVEYRRAKSRFSSGPYSIGLSVGLCLALLLLTACEAASLLQLAYRPVEPYPFGHRSTIVVAVIGAMVVIGVVAVADVLLPTRDEFTRLLERLSVVEDRVAEIGKGIHSITSRAEARQDLPSMIALRQKGVELGEVSEQLQSEIERFNREFRPVASRAARLRMALNKRRFWKRRS